jgi:hypothetical protein
MGNLDSLSSARPIHGRHCYCAVGQTEASPKGHAMGDPAHLPGRSALATFQTATVVR